MNIVYDYHAGIYQYDLTSYRQEAPPGCAAPGLEAPSSGPAEKVQGKTDLRGRTLVVGPFKHDELWTESIVQVMIDGCGFRGCYDFFRYVPSREKAIPGPCKMADGYLLINMNSVESAKSLVDKFDGYRLDKSQRLPFEVFSAPHRLQGLEALTRKYPTGEHIDGLYPPQERFATIQEAEQLWTTTLLPPMSFHEGGPVAICSGEDEEQHPFHTSMHPASPQNGKPVPINLFQSIVGATDKDPQRESDPLRKTICEDDDRPPLQSTMVRPVSPQEGGLVAIRLCLAIPETEDYDQCQVSAFGGVDNHIVYQ